jgi:hypothetical protein
MYLSIALAFTLPAALYFYFIEQKKYSLVVGEHDVIESEYGPITESETLLLDVKLKYKKLQATYKTDLSLLRKRESKLAQYHLGVGTTDTTSYRALLTTDDLTVFEEKLAQVKAKIKDKVSSKEACVCNMGNDFVVNGKRSEAKKLFNREIKLRIRCLDNEFKAAAVVADWNNINRIIQRARNTYSDINAVGEMVKTYLKEPYLNLKIEELRLGYEINQLKADIKEEEREQKQLVREAVRESARIEKAAEKAKKEREIMEKLVASELSKLESSSEEQKSLYEFHKEELEKLKQRESRAVSLAQTTRAGYVYVISNETSFGKGICKIGMTRRAEPYDRVKELGDASVPEIFDVHAFAYTEDAPLLENFLHKTFSDQRVNLVNKRKEFFFVDPEEVLVMLKTFDGTYELNELDEYM